jgi:hypothetical protein
MEAAAEKFGREVTFSNTNPFVESVYNFRRNLKTSKNFGLKAGGYALDLLTLFPRAVSNIFAEATEAAGGGYLTMFGKGLSRAERIEAATKATLGVGAIAMLYNLLDDDDITMAAPRDARARGAFYDSGKTPYAVRLGDKWYGYGNIGPVPSLFAFVAGLKAAVKEEKRQDFWRGGAVLARAGAHFAKYTLIDATSLRQFSEAVDALSGDMRVTMERLGASYLTLGVPESALLRNIANSQDPLMRDPEAFVDWMKNGLPDIHPGRPITPGTRQTLPAKKTGERTKTVTDDIPIANRAQGGRAFLPFSVSDVTPESKLQPSTKRVIAIDETLEGYGTTWARGLPPLTEEETKSAKLSIARLKPEEGQKFDERAESRKAVLRAKLVSLLAQKAVESFIEGNPGAGIDEVEAERTKERAFFSRDYRYDSEESLLKSLRRELDRGKANNTAPGLQVAPGRDINTPPRLVPVGTPGA